MEPDDKTRGRLRRAAELVAKSLQGERLGERLGERVSEESPLSHRTLPLKLFDDHCGRYIERTRSCSSSWFPTTSMLLVRLPMLSIFSYLLNFN